MTVNVCLLVDGVHNILIQTIGNYTIYTGQGRMSLKNLEKKLRGSKKCSANLKV